MMMKKTTIPVFSALFALLFLCLSCEQESPSWAAYQNRSSAKGEIIELEEEEDPVPEDPGQQDTDPQDPTPVDPPVPEPEDDHWFQTRGVILTWEDVVSIDWIALAKTCGINTFSINKVPSYGKMWQDKVAEFTQNGIKVCFQDHLASQLLPRSLFNNHPDYFRVDESGHRNPDYNFCITNPDVQQRIYENAVTLGQTYAPTNHRYYFWADDGGKKCHCANCNKYSASEQWLMAENIIIDALKTVDPDAKLAHLVYNETMAEPPVKVTPKPDIFLQFAPFRRRWDYSINTPTARRDNWPTHGYMTDCLKEHLKIFPAETAEVLEYWLDVSMSSHYEEPIQRIAQWYPSVYQQDIAYYASLGIRHIVTYAMWIGLKYYQMYGDVDFVREYGNGLLNYTKE